MRVRVRVRCKACASFYDKATDEPSCPHRPMDMSQVSDGYHTFAELYEHRHMLFLVLLVTQGHCAWRSRLHADGTMYEGGWFIAGLETPHGSITYHLPERLWSLLDQKVVTLDHAPPWDGRSEERRVGKECRSR